MPSSLKLKNNINSEFIVTHEDNQGAISVSSTDLAKVVSVDTIADLRATTKAQPTVWVSGYHTKGDGAFGSNIFEWDVTSTEDDNGGTIIKLDSVATGRYKLRYSGSVNVKWFGAVGDGITDNSAVFQGIINQNINDIYIPAGTFYSSVSIKLPHTGSYYRGDTGITISGEGIESKVTRLDSTNTSEVAEVFRAQRAFFANYGSNNTISNLLFSECPIAIYNGQDESNSSELSSVSFNKFYNLHIYNCGTGFMSASSGSFYYNSLRDIHIAQCQYGLIFINHSRGVTIDNNNRNTFDNIRTSRCKIGLLLKSGDTNRFSSVHAEGCGNGAINNLYPDPDIAVFSIPTGITDGAHIIEGSNNNFYGCMMESNTFNLYNSGNNNQFFGCLYRANSEPSGIKFDVKPTNWIERDSLWLSNGSFQYFSNNNTEFESLSGTTVRDITGTRPIYNIGSSKYTKDDTPSSYYTSNTKELGALNGGSSTSFTLLYDESDMVNSGILIDVDIVSPSIASSLVFSKSFKVIVLKNISRTIIRYFKYDESNGRSTGLNVGDTGEPIGISLSVDGKNLLCTVTAPSGRNLSEVYVSFNTKKTS